MSRLEALHPGMTLVWGGDQVVTVSQEWTRPMPPGRGDEDEGAVSRERDIPAQSEVASKVAEDDRQANACRHARCRSPQRTERRIGRAASTFRPHSTREGVPAVPRLVTPRDDARVDRLQATIRAEPGGEPRARHVGAIDMERGLDARRRLESGALSVTFSETRIKPRRSVDRAVGSVPSSV